MDSTGNETLDRIQQEIQETLQREEELREKYNLLNNNNHEEHHVNGYTNASPEPPRTNGTLPPPPQPVPRINQRIFTPNPAPSKGLMQKFIKMRGKMNVVSMNPIVTPQTIWEPADSFDPARVTIEPGKTIRNGFVSAEEKMKKELQEFQRREEELRKERRKSQPDLMLALENEESNLKPARSTAILYSNEDLTSEHSGPPSSLKRARSLAELLDASDDELESPGTHSLIMQFESLKSQS